MHPVVCAGRIRCWTLAERCRRAANSSGVGWGFGQRVVEAGDAVGAGVVGTALARRAVGHQIARCVAADAWLTVCVLVERS